MGKLHKASCVYRSNPLELWKISHTTTTPDVVQYDQQSSVLHTDTHLAKSLHDLGLRFCENAQWKEACNAAAESVKLRRHLYTLDPDTHRVDLANSLCCLDGYLARLDLWEDARAAAAKSVDLYRDIYKADPDLHRAQLARLLHELSVDFHHLELWEDGRRASAEAVELRRYLFIENPDAHRADLAISFHFLAFSLGERSFGKKRAKLVKIQSNCDGIYMR